MIVVAILQNAWFQNPDTARRLFERWKDNRHKLIYRLLFAGCLTGDRLEKAFGEEQCKRIVWEEASMVIGGHSGFAAPADTSHITDVFLKHRPNVVLAFGKIAITGVNSVANYFEDRPTIIEAPHPAARHASVCADLRRAAMELKECGPI